VTPEEWRAGVKNLLPQWLVQRRLEVAQPRRLLLTFDDGPSPDVTPHVLERLKHHRAKAVFFVVGERVEERPDLLEAILAGGHYIGNHTFTHPNHHNPSLDEYLEDLRRCQSVIARHAPHPWLFRPPRGHLSVGSLIAPRILGLRLIHWSLNVRDWKCRSAGDAAAAAAAFIRGVEPGHIALLHDNNPCVVDVLDAVLPHLEASGYDLASALGEMQPAAAASHAILPIL
jgi:peptidoglycan/xylan/chitin deacetylase (PgdA/CDA1 family)